MAPSSPGRPVTAFGFHGMNNLPHVPADLFDQERKITPHIALNVEVSDGGVLECRGGFKQVNGMPGLHSLWGGSALLGVGVADNILYRLEGQQRIPLMTISGPRAPMQYVEINNLVYLSNSYWSGVYDLLVGTVRSWGITLPPAPEISFIEGDFAPGTYVLAYTRTESGQLSGNGSLVQVTWEGGTRGIQLNNLPAGGQAWITQPNGKTLLLANLTGNVLSGQVPQATPLPTLSVQPPPKFADFCQAFGRIWGINGKRLYYSSPFQYEWFRSSQFVPFLENLVMVAPVTMGLFVSSLTSTWFLEGREPGKMIMTRVGEGAIPGTLSFAEMPASVAGGAMTSQIFATLAQMPTPVWMSPTGFVVGTHTGHLTHLTMTRMRIVPRSKGASLYRMKDGVPQILITMRGTSRGEADSEMVDVFTRGTMFIPAPYVPAVTGGFTLGGE